MMRRMQKGDTIIEVIIAFAVFSLAAVMSMEILNRGVEATQRDLELTLVRQQVDSQAEMLRYVRDTADLKGVWASIKAGVTTNPKSIGESCTTSLPSNAFIFTSTVNGGDPSKTTISRKIVSSSTVGLVPSHNYPYAQMTYRSATDYSITGAKGIWIEAAEARGSTNVLKAYDFYIHACWDSVGVNVPMTSGTIVRIYD